MDEEQKQSSLAELVSSCGTKDEAMRLMETAVQQTNEGILITDADLEPPGPKIVFVNPAFTKMTGWAEHEALGKNPRVLQGPESDREMLTRLKEALMRGKSFTGQTVNYRKDRTPYNVEWHISPVKNEAGDVTHWISVQEDVTARKKAEDELKRYTETLEEEVQRRTQDLIQSEKMASVGLLVAGVAHEVNNPLAYIKSNNELTQELALRIRKELPEDHEASKDLDNLISLLETNEKGMNRIAVLTTTLKRFAKPDEGDRDLADINQGMKDTLLIVYNKFKHRIKVTEDYGEIPQTKCAIGQINQVFLNLLLNASEAMEKGNVWVSTRHEGSYIVIDVKDDGPGMNEDVQRHLFDPFFTTKSKGTGLGLSLSYKIIRQHNGHIEVLSKVGEGTTMSVRIPVER